MDKRIIFLAVGITGLIFFLLQSDYIKREYMVGFIYTFWVSLFYTRMTIIFEALFLWYFTIISQFLRHHVHGISQSFHILKFIIILKYSYKMNSQSFV